MVEIMRSSELLKNRLNIKMVHKDGDSFQGDSALLGGLFIGCQHPKNLQCA